MACIALWVVEMQGAGVVADCPLLKELPPFYAADMLSSQTPHRFQQQKMEVTFPQQQ